MSDNSNSEIEQLKAMLDQIQSNAKDLRDNGYSALDQATGAAAQGIAAAQKKALADLQALKEDKASVRGEDATGWEGFKDSFHNFFAKARVHHDENQIDRNVEKANHEAQKAADAAANSLNHAVEALQASQVAVLDAVQAYAYADEYAADT